MKVEKLMQVIGTIAPTTTRIESNTQPEMNELIRLRTDAQLARLENAERIELDARLAELDREWDAERALQVTAGSAILASVALGLALDRRFLWLTAGVLAFFGQHALQGWCPPLPLLRRRGVRTMREIERERYAVKALRGDFDRVPAPGTANTDRRVRAALVAVDA
jgi:hypothetical protein